MAELFGIPTSHIQSRIDDPEYRRRIIEASKNYHPTCALIKALCKGRGDISADDYLEMLIVALLCENAEQRALMVEMHQNMRQIIEVPK